MMNRYEAADLLRGLLGKSELERQAPEFRQALEVAVDVLKGGASNDVALLYRSNPAFAALADTVTGALAQGLISSHEVRLAVSYGIERHIHQLKNPSYVVTPEGLRDITPTPVQVPVRVRLSDGRFAAFWPEAIVRNGREPCDQPHPDAYLPLRFAQVEVYKALGGGALLIERPNRPAAEESAE